MLLSFEFIYLIVFCFTQVATETSNSTLLPFEYREGQRYIFFPDGYDRLHLIDLQDRHDIKWKFEPSRDIILNLFTRNNLRKPLIIDSDNVTMSIESFLLDKVKPIKIVVHGWRSGLFGKIHSILTTDMLGTLDTNVIFLDWNFVANRNYLLVVGVVPEVGIYLANVIDALVNYGIPLQNIHLIGHSLGAHIVGIAGRSIQSGTIPYITAFDPALPLWPAGGLRIRPSDAEYVEVIHTNAGILGIKDPVGDADFYPNGGTNQPGCTFDLACAHSRSFLYFADSLDHDRFKAVQCATLDEATVGSTCANLSISYMGGSKPKITSGIFFLETNADRPFYRG